MAIRINAPLCPHCKRILIVTNGKCLCCGKEVTVATSGEK